jgi:DNA-binding NtrC family response regulator
MSSSPVLITWVAVNNDPYERESGSGEPRVVDGEFVPGPTLTLLCDEDSPYVNRVRDVVLLHRAKNINGTERESWAVKDLTKALADRSFQVHSEPWGGSDPTDHREIFEFLRTKLPGLRRRFHGRELILHVSPGTPSMHTVWVLMAETGFVEKPFSLVKSYRRSERNGRPAVVPIEVGIDTFYKAYKASRPSQIGSEDQGVIWDPGQFKTDLMKQVYSEARRFAQVNVPVLIRGERGTGKTTLANWIRSNSPFRREEQDTLWPSVACGQYSSETMRAELFGYKKGAFTGATSDREGLLSAAHGDTLFLDEIGDVSHDLQRLLIRAIEEKQFFALGDDQPRRSDFRLITATNISDSDLKTRLDADFLDRVSLLTLVLPPLRDIPEELHWLWPAVYREASRRAGVASKNSITESDHRDVVDYLARHPLMGNLRDLFRVAYRMLAAQSNIDQPMMASDAVMYGLKALDSRDIQAHQSVAQSIAAAFASGASIDDLVKDGEMIETSYILAEVKSYIANELRRISSDRNVKLDQLCDVSDRTLREWVSGRQGARRKSSD